jgi:hypothetical protein
MYTLTFLITLPLFLISLLLFGYALIRSAQRSPGARGILTAGLSVWLISIITGALIFIFV